MRPYHPQTSDRQSSAFSGRHVLRQATSVIPNSKIEALSKQRVLQRVKQP